MVPDVVSPSNLGGLEGLYVGNVVPVTLAVFKEPFPGAKASRDDLRGANVEDEDLGLRNASCEGRGKNVLKKFRLDDEESDLSGLDVVGDFKRFVCWVGAAEDASGSDAT